MIKSILKKMAGADIQELVRDELNIVHDVVDLDKMDEKERKEFLRSAHDLFENKALNKILDHLLALQKEAITKKAQTLEQLWAGRASLVGIKQVRSEIAKLEKWWQAELNEVPFDKYSIL